MTVYRRVHISFWQDPDVLELTPEQKYFYLYLMTNSKTRQCGCYEISKKVMQLETGYNAETIDKLIGYFVDAGKIEYCDDTREILLRNWHKHNSSKSPRVKACIEKEVETIKNTSFKTYCIDTLCIEYSNTMYTDPQKEKEKEKEKEKGEQKEVNSKPIIGDNFQEVIKAFNNNIHPITPMEAETFSAWLDDGVEAGLIVWAIKQSVINGKRNARYIDAIIKNLVKEGITTLAGAEAKERDRQDKKEKTQQPEHKQNCSICKEPLKNDQVVKVEMEGSSYPLICCENCAKDFKNIGDG